MEELNRLYDRYERLKKSRLTVVCDLSRYTEGLNTARWYVDSILEQQMNLITRQFRKHSYWMSLMFWEGLSSVSGPSTVDVRPDEAVLVSSVDALQISLMLFRLLTFTRCLSRDQWLWEGIQILDEDAGEEAEITLQGCVAGIIDYIVTVACQELQNICSADDRNDILKWYGSNVDRLCREQNVLCKSKLSAEGLLQLRAIWWDTQSNSAYYLGAAYSDREVDPSKDALLKEFEFWKSLAWLHRRLGVPKQNLRCADYDVNGKLDALMNSEELDINQRA